MSPSDLKKQKTGMSEDTMLSVIAFAVHRTHNYYAQFAIKIQAAARGYGVRGMCELVDYYKDTAPELFQSHDTGDDIIDLAVESEGFRICMDAFRRFWKDGVRQRALKIERYLVMMKKDRSAEKIQRLTRKFLKKQRHCVIYRPLLFATYVTDPEDLYKPEVTNGFKPIRVRHWKLYMDNILDLDTAYEYISMHYEDECSRDFRRYRDWRYFAKGFWRRMYEKERNLLKDTSADEEVRTIILGSEEEDDEITTDFDDGERERWLIIRENWMNFDQDPPSPNEESEEEEELTQSSGALL